MKSCLKFKIIFALILILGIFYRLYQLNWDQNQHLQPDERSMTMMIQTLRWPASWQELINPQLSPLNFYNTGNSFFVYGSLPAILVKIISPIIKLDLYDYNNITLVGRLLSALFEVGILFLVFQITKEIFNKETALGAFFFYSVSVLPIQLAHFFAVDTFLTFFLVLSFYFLLNKLISPNYFLTPFLCGASFGLALASKISAILFLPIIILGFGFGFLKNRRFGLLLLGFSIFLISSYLSWRLTDPHAFGSQDLFNPSLNSHFINNLKEIASYNQPSTWFPPSIQWLHTKPFIYPLKNIILWGLGLPLALISFLAVIFQIKNLLFFKKRRYDSTVAILLILLWIGLLFGYQSIQLGKPLRYYYPFFPFLAVISGLLLEKIVKKLPFVCSCVLVLILLVYPFSFISIYSRPPSRISASEWIYQHLPFGSKISWEHWDDALPLNLPKPNALQTNYQLIEFPLYAQDTPEKWQDMTIKLKKVDYIILSSNRLYGSITSAPERYPLTNKFYRDLFSGALGFMKIAEFTSRPNLPVPFIRLCLTPSFSRYGIIALKQQECPLDGISFVDDYSDETFTVYDHPKVLIFQKK